MKRQQTNLPPLKKPTLNVQRPTLNVQGERRSGVALVIVLGLLALLMITAVSFTILMRIERSGASNLRHAAAARQMAKGGLAYAIAAMNDNIGTASTPDWPDRLFKTASDRTGQERNGLVVDDLRIPEDIFISVYESENNPRSIATARVLSAESVHYLPAALRYRAEMIAKDGENYAAPEWIPVDAMGANVGRYAYVVLNTTGLLDANVVHSTLTNRWMGGSPTEVRLDPDVQLDVVDTANFASQRTTHGRYETLPELSRKNTGIDGNALANFDVFSYSLPDRIPINPPPGASADMIAEHKAILLQQGGNFDNKISGTRIDIRSETKIKAQQAKIKQAFKASGLNDIQANWAYLGLLDYVDEDNEPAGTGDQEKFERPATEAMPLFSAVTMRVTYTRDAPVERDSKWYVTHRMNYKFSAHYSYPFQKTAGPFTLKADIIFAPNMFNPEATFNHPNYDQWEKLTPFEQTFELSESGIECDPGYYGWISAEHDTAQEFEQSETIPPVNRFVVFCRAKTLNHQGLTIRQLPAQAPLGYDARDYMVRMNVEMSGNALNPGTSTDAWSESLDPRCNWSGIHAYWRANRDFDWGGVDGGTDPNEAPLFELEDKNILPGYICPAPLAPGVNSLTEYLLTHPAALTDYFKIVTDGVMGKGATLRCDAVDPQFKAHVADQPLQSVGELGYLPIGFWLTINLFDHGHANYNLGGGNIYKNNGLPPIGYHPVLDYFNIGDPDKGQRGKVHLNAVNPEVMGAVFNQLPLQSEFRKPAPPAARGTELAAPSALALAEWLIEKGPFDRLSGLGKLFDNPGNAPANPLQLLTAVTGGATEFGEFEREALIRNACGLFTLRGQTFTVILRADAFAPKFGMTGVKQGNVLATANAVAQVWRDTEPMVSGTKTNYPTFIQLFKILNE